MLDKIFMDHGFDKFARILDCACGIGTQAIGLAALGYHMTASDISEGELAEARERAAKDHVQIQFEQEHHKSNCTGRYVCCQCSGL